MNLPISRRWNSLAVAGLCSMSATLAAPALVMDRLDPAADGLRVTWSAIPGHQYRLWSTTDLNDSGAWVAVLPQPWTAPTTSLSRGIAAVGGGGFYRVDESKPEASPYDPSWAGLQPSRVLTLTYDDQRTPVENGAALKAALLGLLPGDRLEIGTGTFSLDSYTTLDLQGTPEAPIWVVAADAAVPVLTRPDGEQNLVNVGVNRPARYLCFRGLEFTGGSHGIRLYDCAQVWIDRCRVHDTGGVAISANARNTSHLHITRNEIWNPGGTAEGMYLGANNGAVIMSESVIALNHVHDTVGDGSQGDGIEVKQGSWGNWIAENHIHDCHYPCLLVYGTAGQPENIVERNICYRSDDNAMQVQGEAVVRNNLVIGGSGSAFASQPHQGDPTRLRVLHNTFISGGRAARLASWALGTGMVFANNACYSRQGEALTVLNSGDAAQFSGNVCFGSVSPGVAGFRPGMGLSDFQGVTWDGTQRNARPAADSPLIGAGDAAYAAAVDLEGGGRTAPHTAGCYGPQVGSLRSGSSSLDAGSGW